MSSNADQVLEYAGERIYEEFGEVAEDVFRVKAEVEQELDELLKALTRKQLTGRYWLCTGKRKTTCLT